jgi:phosphate:Na+ symporter
MSGLVLILNLFGALAVFLFGMKIMSEALQKVAGDRLKRLLSAITANRFSGVITGFVTTCVVQSSSATTVMVVSFVAAELLTLTQAIGVVMGANIGTTITAWLVALLGFKIKVTSFALPAIAIGLAMTFIKGARAKQWGEVILGFGLLFLGLGLLKKSVPEIEPEQLTWVTDLNQYGILSTLAFIAIGTALTVVLQSSSATMTLTLTMTALGLIPYDASIAMVLGENIGTTATANLAAIGSTVAARRTARAHFLFNIFGVIWAVLLLRLALMPLVDAIVPGDPVAVELNPEGEGAGSGIIAAHLAAFHTLFNITNTLLLLPFVKHLAKLVSKWIPDEKPVEVDPERKVTRYVSTALVQTPELLLIQAGKEMQYMLGVAQAMFADAMRLVANPRDHLGSLVDDTLEREQLTDDLEREISQILSLTARAATSADASRRLAEMSLNTHRIERIGDHCEKLVKIAIRNHDAKDEGLDDQAIEDITELGALVGEALNQLSKYLAGEGTIAQALEIEERIDAMRDRLRARHLERISEGNTELVQGLWLLDALHHLEEIGDRAYGIVRRIEETKQL